MDGLTFLSNLAKYLAWPSLVAFLVWKFTPQLADLFSRITELSFPGGNAKFTNELKLAEDTKEKAIAETPVLRGDPAQPIYSYSAVNDPVVELASRFPELAVLESFKVVERALTGLMTNAPTKLTNSNVSQFVAKLYKEEMIGPTHFTWFQELRSLRADPRTC